MKRMPGDAYLDGQPHKWIDEDVLLESVQNGLFHIGVCCEEDACKTYFCKKCGGNKFYVGTGSYYTALKCPICEWEICVHDG